MTSMHDLQCPPAPKRIISCLLLTKKRTAWNIDNSFF
jgi:hypothetical protein